MSRPQPSVLPGWSSMRLNIVGLFCWSLVIPCVIAIAFESYLGAAKDLWKALWLGMSMAAVVVGLILQARGIMKVRKEDQHGYATSPGRATERTDLYFLHPVTFEVLRRPGEERGPNLGHSVALVDVLRGRRPALPST